VDATPPSAALERVVSHVGQRQRPPDAAAAALLVLLIMAVTAFLWGAPQAGGLLLDLAQPRVVHDLLQEVAHLRRPLSAFGERAFEPVRRFECTFRI